MLRIVMMSVFLLMGTTMSVNAQNQANSVNKSEMTQKRSELIRRIFNDLRATNTNILDEFYTSDVVFEDPLGQINGLDNMKKYYQAMYKNVQEIRFEFKDDAIAGDRHLSTWVMYLRADGLNGGKEVAVHGVSEIEFQSESTLVIFHRDYFDMGEFIYQYIPVLGGILKLVRKQLEFKPE